MLGRKPLLLGTGPLKNWLRNLACGHIGPMVAVDIFNDNLCLLCCIAVYLMNRIRLKGILIREPPFGLASIRVYEHTREAEGKKGNEELPSCNHLRFRIVPRQETVKGSNGFTHERNCLCNDFSEHR